MINQPNVGFINFSPLYTSAEFFYNEDFNLLITKTSGMFALKLSDDCKANESYSFAVEPKFSFLTREGGKIATNNFITLHPSIMSKYIGFMAESIEYSQCLHEGKPIAKYKGARRFIWGTILSEKEKDAYLQKNSDFIELKALPDSKVRWYAVNESHKVIVPLEQNCFAIPFKEWRAIK